MTVIHDDSQEDEIMEEWDIFINTELTPFLHLTPLPSPSLSARFAASPTTSARFKPQARRLEILLPLADLDGANLVGERVRELQMEKGQKLSGAGWQWRRVQYLLGQFTTDGELHLNPVESVIPLNSSLSHLDDFDARTKLSSTNSSGTSSRRSNPQEDPAASATTTTSAGTNKTIQVQFRKKETEEQVQARLNSFAYLQRQVDDEAWIPLKHFNSKAQEVVAVRDKLIGTFKEPLEFVQDEDYLEKVITK